MIWAGYLPGIADDAVDWQTLSFDRGGSPVEISVPSLSQEQIAALSDRVRAAAREKLKTLPVTRIVNIVDAAIARLLDRNDPYRQRMEELLPVITGYDAEMVRLGLTEYLKTFRKPQLTRFLAEDFPNPACLDDFQPLAKGGFAKAHGPDLLLHVWAGNVPGLPLWSFVSGLLVKAGAIGKVPSAEPLFASLFAQLLAEIEPEIADCFAVVWWKGGDPDSKMAFLKEADTVIAYGGNEALTALRQNLPVTTRFLAHGHKVSFGLVSKNALDTKKAPETARKVAWDIVRYDQQGCYSPHMFFVERGARVSPRDFARYVASELAAFQHRFPNRALSIAEAGDVAAWRQAEEMRLLSNAGSELMSDPDGAWSVVYDDSAETLAPSGLNRTIRIAAVDTLEDAIPAISPFKPFLQTVGIAAAPEELFSHSALLGEAGVTRISALGRMTAPEAGWHHDGRFSLLDLVTLTEIEATAETAAESLAPYAD